jgi:hypothetical protein
MIEENKKKIKRKFRNNLFNKIFIIKSLFISFLFGQKLMEFYF